jgi:uncharacterized Zn-finger protein
MGSTTTPPGTGTPATGQADGAAWYRDNPEVQVVTTKKVACDGGGGALGHPKVWYDMSEGDFVECKYCDRVFALKGGSRDPGK